MNKLSIALVQDRLLREYELKQVAQIKGPEGKMPEGDGPDKRTYKRIRAKRTRPHEVAKPRKPELKLTRITQVEMPKGKMGESKDGGDLIPRSKRGDEIVDRMDRPTWKSDKPDGSPKVPTVKRDKPNQTTKLKQINNAIRNTEDDRSDHGRFIPQSKGAGEYERRMDRGIFDRSDRIGGVVPPKPKSLNGTTRPKRSERRSDFSYREQKIKQVEGPSGRLPQPDGAPTKPKVNKNTGGAENVVEASGITVRLGNKVKAQFDVVRRAVLNQLVEDYRRHGYRVQVERTKAAAWMTDKEFLRRLYERIDAKWNGLTAIGSASRKTALNRFYQLRRGSYHRLYERREDFLDTVRMAFRRVEEAAEKKYLDGLELFECQARVKVKGKVVDVRMTTEATGHPMALRRVRAKIAESYGLDSAIQHIFVDGQKYRGSRIPAWKPRS